MPHLAAMVVNSTMKGGSVIVSIVSHGHVDLIEKLLDDIAPIEEIAQVIVTMNTPERNGCSYPP